MPRVVTFGEAMVRLSPPAFGRLETARSLDVAVGGAELNIAVGLSRLGTSAGWVSALPDNPLGRMVVNEARRFGVDVSGVRFAPGRAGLYFIEQGAAPRAGSVLYDRADSAMSRIRPGDFDWPALLAGAELFHSGGITPALSDGAAEVASEALTAARKLGVRTGFDVNFRAKLWPIERAREVITALSDRIDVLFTNVETARSIHGIEAADAAETARELIDRWGFRVVALTQRQEMGVWRNRWSACAADHTGAFVQARGYEVEIVDRVGAGDAFAAGFLHGMLDGDLAKAVEWGTALSALKHTTPGDFSSATADEVEALVRGGPSLRISR